MNDRTGTVFPGGDFRSRTSGPGAIPGTRPVPAGRAGDHRGTEAAAWPLFSGLGPLGALPTVPRLARTYTVLVLGSWELGDMAEAGELIVSELATNVVRAATGPDGSPAYGRDGRLPVLWVRLMTDRSLLGIEVWDTLPAAAGVPDLRAAAPDAESGRGLEIVAGLSVDWGWEPVPGARAKRTWALLAVA